MSFDTIRARRDEVAEKLARVRSMLERERLGGVLISSQTHLSWLGAGLQNVIERNADHGFVRAVVTAERAVLLTQNIEGPRIVAEERAEELGFEVAARAWWDTDYDREARKLVPVGELGQDGAGPGRDVSAELQLLRLSLTATEQDRLARLADDATQSLEQAMAGVVAGTPEVYLAAAISAELELRAIVPLVLLIGSDDRRFDFRHPTVSGAAITSGAFGVVVGVRGGLHAALTRTISLGPPSDELLRRHRAAAEVEAAMISATTAGSTYGQALERGIERYAALGFKGEWEKHYQGGSIGYHSREISPNPLACANRQSHVAIENGHAFAWNPTVRGAKSEDTFLVTATGPRWLTRGDQWPLIEVETGGRTLQRPGILDVAS